MGGELQFLGREAKGKKEKGRQMYIIGKCALNG